MSKLRWVFSLSLCSVALLSAPLLVAQEAAPAAPDAPIQYETIDIPEAIVRDGRPTDATLKIRQLVKAVYSGAQTLQNNEAAFDNYFTRYLFASWTQTDDKTLAGLYRQRNSFFRDDIANSARKPEVHDHLVQLTYRSMKDIVTKNYHPAVRYNAMMVIGDLNTKEAVFSGAAALPLPYSEALDFMVAEARNPKQVDAVRVAALLGIYRHVDLNAHSQQPYPAAVRQNLVKQIAPLAMDKKVPGDRSDDGHAWIRARAFEILGALGQASYDAAMAKALLNVVGDTNEHLDVRFAAGTALGRMNFTTATDIAGDEMARKLADLALQSAREQLAQLDAEIAAEKERLKREGGGVYEGVRPSISSPIMEYSPGSLIPVKVVKLEQRLTTTQRLLKDRMVKTTFGLEGPEGKTGATSAAKGAQKQYVTNVGGAVVALRKVGDLKDARTQGVPKIADLAKEMRLKIDDLDRVAKTGGAPAPAAEPEVPAAAESPDEEPGAAPAPMKKKAPAADPLDEAFEDPAPAAPAPKKAPAAEEGPEAP